MEALGRAKRGRQALFVRSRDKESRVKPAKREDKCAGLQAGGHSMALSLRLCSCTLAKRAWRGRSTGSIRVCPRHRPKNSSPLARMLCRGGLDYLARDAWLSYYSTYYTLHITAAPYSVPCRLYSVHRTNEHTDPEWGETLSPDQHGGLGRPWEVSKLAKLLSIRAHYGRLLWSRVEQTSTNALHSGP